MCVCVWLSDTRSTETECISERSYLGAVSHRKGPFRTNQPPPPATAPVGSTCCCICSASLLPSSENSTRVSPLGYQPSHTFRLNPSTHNTHTHTHTHTSKHRPLNTGLVCSMSTFSPSVIGQRWSCDPRPANKLRLWDFPYPLQPTFTSGPSLVLLTWAAALAFPSDPRTRHRPVACGAYPYPSVPSCVAPPRVVFWLI